MRIGLAEGHDGTAMEELALDRAVLEHYALGRVELVESRGQQRLDRRRNRDVAVGGVTDELDHLLDEERVAARRPPDPRLQLLVRIRALDQARDQFVGLGLGERLQEHVGRVQHAAAPRRSPVEQLGPRHAEEEDGHPAGQVGDVLDEVEEGLLAPLDVVEETDDRLLRGVGLEELAERPRDLVGCRGRVGLAEQPVERVADDLVDERGVVAELLHDLDHGPVGDALAVGEASPADDRGSFERLQELRDESRLAHARRPEHGEELTRAVAGDVLEGAAQQLELTLAAHHRDPEAAGRLVALDREQPVGAERLGLPLQLEWRERLDRHRVPQQAVRLRAEQDLAGLCRLLQAGRDVHRVSGREPLLRARHDLARVDADSQRERRPVVPLELVVQRLERLAQLGGGANRAQGVVLVHLGHAEDGHHGVADELLHRAAVLLDHRLGGLEVARQHVAQALRIEPLAERGRAGDVAEEDGDGLPLLARRRGRRQRRGALVAEPCSRRVVVTAARTDRHVQRLERRAADDQPQCSAGPPGGQCEGTPRTSTAAFIGARLASSSGRRQRATAPQRSRRPLCLLRSSPRPRSGRRPSDSRRRN